MSNDSTNKTWNRLIADDDCVESIRFIDAVITVAAFAALLAGAAFGFRTMSSHSALWCGAIVATGFAAYKTVRVVLEYRAGVSVRFSRRGGSDYWRAMRPYAFWFAMGIEAAWLLIGAGIALATWVAIALS